MGKQIFIFLVFFSFQSKALASASPLEAARDFFIHQNYEKAHEKLDEISTNKMDPKKKALIELFRALVFFEQQDYKSSIKHLSRSLQEKKFHLRDVAHYYLGLSHLGLKKYKLAQRAFQRVSVPDSSGFVKNRARFHLAETLFATGKYDSSRKIFKKLERKLRSTKLHPHILWTLLRIDKKRKKTACRWAQKLYRKYPAYGPISHWGLTWKNNRLDGKPLSCPDRMKDQEDRIKRLQWMGAGKKAYRELGEFEKSEKDKFKKDSLMAIYLVNEGMVMEALDRLKPHYRSKQRDKDYIELYAKVATRADKYQEAMDIYTRAYKRIPGAKGRGFVFKAAFLSYQNQNYDRALELFVELKNKHPFSSLAKQAHWYIAWIHYLKGEYQRSFDLMKMALEKRNLLPRSISEGKLKYWMAVSMEKLGKKTKAKEIFLEVLQDESMGYYSIASMQRLRGLLDPQSLAIFEQNDFRGLAHFIKGLKESARAKGTKKDFQNGKEASRNLSQNKKRSGGSPVFSGISEPEFHRRIQRARDLSSIGMAELAKWELYSIERKTNDRDYLKTLMYEYYRSNIFHRSAYIGSLYLSDKREKLPLWEFIYPRAFETEVLKNSEKFEVPPELVWSVMKAETNFRPDAISPVGAKGLMQVMTHTGRKVASLMGKQIEGLDLYKPSVGVEIGTRYLKRVLEKFKGKIPLAAAAYNGGPHRVHQWLYQFGGPLEMDEFIEHIPFRETRRYVKKVTRYYTVYHLLYNKNLEASSWLADDVNVYLEGSHWPTREHWEKRYYWRQLATSYSDVKKPSTVNIGEKNISSN